MKKTNKKGFTLTELIVVIVIIGILIAVLIPLLTSYINRSRKSSDNQLVRNLNQALSYDETTLISGRKHQNMYEALEATKESGFDVSKINATARNNEILWDSVNDVFCYFNDGNIEYIPEAPRENPVEDYEYFVIRDVKALGDISNKYSTYLRSCELDSITTTKGIDTGEQSVSSILYQNAGTAQDNVIIRTNSQFTSLVIDAASDEVTHYGNASVIHITAVKFGTYHEYGSVGAINLKAGKVEIQKNAFVGKVAIDKDATTGNGANATDIAVVNAGTVFATDIIKYDATEYTHDALTTEEQAAMADSPLETLVEAVDTTSDSDTIKVGTAEALMNLAFAQSTGIITGNDGVFNIELTANIDLTGKTWIPFGAELGSTTSASETKQFSGTIDGKGYTITGLSNGTYIGRISANTNTPISGDIYAFIATTKDDVTVRNITFNDVNIKSDTTKVTAAVIGDTKQSKNHTVTLEKVFVNGSIQGKDKVSGLIGYVEGVSTNVTTVNVNNCGVNVAIKASSYRAGLAFGHIGTGSHVIINGLKLAGSVSANYSSNEKCTGILSGYLDGGNGEYNVKVTIKENGVTFGDSLNVDVPSHSKDKVNVKIGENWLPFIGRINYYTGSGSSENFEGKLENSTATLFECVSAS